MNNPLLLLAETVKDFPDIFRVQTFYRRSYFVHNPEYVKHILQDNNKNYHKGKSYDMVKSLLGNGLLTSEDELWHRQRRLAQPAFHKKRLDILADIVQDCTDQWLHKWTSHEGYFDFTQEIAHLTIDIVSKALFGAGNVTQHVPVIYNAMNAANEAGIRRVRNPFALPEWVPTPDNRRIKQTILELNRVVNGIITERRQSDAQHDDLLAMLMEAVDEETGEGMSNQLLRDEVMTLFVAGHETTVNALSWAIYLLASHPHIKEQLKEEIDGVLHGQAPSFADMRRLPYTLQVLNETMRLYPPAYAIGRKALEEDWLGEYYVAPDMNVVLNIYGIHHHPAYWADPHAFKPERFSNYQPKGSAKFAFFPFGGGPRQCIGKNFALLEMIVILAMIMQRMDFEIPENAMVKPGMQFTLKPIPSVKVQFKKRKKTRSVLPEEVM